MAECGLPRVVARQGCGPTWLGVAAGALGRRTRGCVQRPYLVCGLWLARAWRQPSVLTPGPPTPRPRSRAVCDRGGTG